MLLPPTMSDRYWAQVVKGPPEACWPWTGTISNRYGLFYACRAKSRRAHRFAYEDTLGTIPDGLGLDHLCGNRLCCNPRHLEPVTSDVNTWRHHVGNRRRKGYGDEPLAVYTVTLPQALIDRLEAMAVERGGTFSGVVRDSVAAGAARCAGAP